MLNKVPRKSIPEEALAFDLAARTTEVVSQVVSETVQQQIVDSGIQSVFRVRAIIHRHVTTSGTITTDGIQLAVDDIVLPIAQENPADRRPMVVQAGAWTVAEQDPEKYRLVHASEGVGHGLWEMTTPGVIVPGATWHRWVKLTHVEPEIYLRMLHVGLAQLSSRTHSRRVCQLTAGRIGYTDLAASSETAIKWDKRGGVFADDTFSHDTIGRSSKIYVSDPGVYTVTANIYGISTESELLSGSVRRNGIVVSGGRFLVPCVGAAGVVFGTCCVPIQCLAGDYLDVTVHDPNSAVTSASTSDGGETSITIIKEI